MAINAPSARQRMLEQVFRPESLSHVKKMTTLLKEAIRNVILSRQANPPQADGVAGGSFTPDPSAGKASG